MNRALVLCCAVVGAALTACSAAASPSTGTVLAATMTSPVDIRLTWTGADPAAAGRIVEFATAPDGPWTTLQFMPMGQDSYVHPSLMPQTSFYYRLRPYYGPASGPVTVTVPGGSEGNDGKDWPAPATLPGGPAVTHSIHSADPAATPTELKAKVLQSNGILFTWTDNASDEEGYLLEDKPAGAADYSVVAVLDKDINSFALITLPDEDTASYRVRAYYYGPSSNVVTRKTGGD
ncbi:fibronectin type III domain-containing protein [Kutzneria sp. NPDC052558]|uniref:fibronectin type III domain-containing protein n=1 Tax=Kutzneria sp. NPDC052558 TaxID=3364121 RepID=UPI0037C5BA60